MPAEARIAVLETPIGRLWLEATSVGLRSITRTEQPDLTGRLDADALTDPLRQLDEYFRGRRRTFSMALDLSGRGAFDAAVWRAAIAIPYGRTMSYGDLAAIVGSPRAARAVGGAMSRCPLNPVVPCHRVIHADGSIGGWGSESWVKRWYLRHEHAARGG